MTSRRVLLDLLLTAAIAAFFFLLEINSISSFETRLAVGLCLVLFLIIWSPWPRTYRAKLTAASPCLMGAFFVLFLVERGFRDLGTLIGGAGFLVGLIGLVFELRSKAELADDGAD